MKDSLAFKISIAGICAVLLAVAAFIPDTAGLAFGGRMSIAIFLAAIILWVTEIMPVVISAWLMVALIPLLGIIPAMDTWGLAMNNVIVFQICCFTFSAFFAQSSLTMRLTAWIMRVAGTNTRLMLLLFMIVTALISTVTDNLPITAVMLSVSYVLLDANNTPAGRKSGLAKCFAIGIPFAACIGGVVTPVGCVMNIMALSMLQEAFGFTISFLQWISFGLPLAVIALPITWLTLCAIFKPEQLNQEAVDHTLSVTSDAGKVPRKDILGLAIIVITLIVWICGADTATIGLVAVGLLFFPGIKAVDFERFVAEAPWGVMLLVMAVNVLVGAIVQTGASAWVVDVALAPVAAISAFAAMVVLTIIACVLHNFIPAGPACLGLIVVPFCGIIASVGGNVAACCFMCAVWSSISFLLPLDAVPLLSYSDRRAYYSISDMAKVGWVPSVVMSLIMVTLTPVTANLLGLM